MPPRAVLCLLFALPLVLAGCRIPDTLHRQAGGRLDDGDFGQSIQNNTAVQTGQVQVEQAMMRRFAAEVPDTITFATASAALSPAAKAVLDQQANWIKQFPDLRFRVYGHTDLVGSETYNRDLGQRRARAVVTYFTEQGISPSRLEMLVSYGKTRPLIQTPGPEERNRRTVTEVAGFVPDTPRLLNGQFAQIIWQTYVGTGGDLGSDLASAATEAAQ